MKDKIYLVLSENKVERMTKNPPPLGPNEIYISLDVRVPNEIFKRPTFSGTMNVSDQGNGFELKIKEIEQEIQRLRNHD